MVIVAKFASICPCCNASIAVGSKVEWSRGNKARHVSCTGAFAAPAKTARSARRHRGARYCEGWGADNPHAPRPPYTCTMCEGE